MRFTSTLAFVLATLTIAACGGDDGGPSVIDARRIDGAGGPDAASACAFPASISIGAATMINLTRTDSTMNPGVYRLTTGVALGMDMPPDALFVQFYNNYAPFGTTAAPGAIDAQTYTIDAAQSSFETCGVCIILSPDFANGMGSADYMPSGGTITITDIDPTVGGTYSLTMANLTFREVTIDPMSGATANVPGGCTVTLTDGSMSGTIAAPMAKAAPGLFTARTKN